MKQIVTNIRTCHDCPHKDHTGSFTKGGAKDCCNHRKTVESKGYDCFNRIIKDPNKIPGWCPLENEATMSVFIYLEGGLIQDVTKAPENIEVIVRDYDIEGVEENELVKDPDGKECVQSVW